MPRAASRAFTCVAKASELVKMSTIVPPPTFSTAAERLHPEHVVEALNKRGTPAALLADADAIVAAVAPQLKPGDVVAILSNGGFGNIYQKLPAVLAARRSVSQSV